MIERLIASHLEAKGFDLAAAGRRGRAGYVDVTTPMKTRSSSAKTAVSHDRIISGKARRHRRQIDETAQPERENHVRCRR